MTALWCVIYAAEVGFVLGAWYMTSRRNKRWSNPTRSEYFAVPYSQRRVIFGDQPQFEQRQPGRHVPLTLDKPERTWVR